MGKTTTITKTTSSVFYTRYYIGLQNIVLHSIYEVQNMIVLYIDKIAPSEQSTRVTRTQQRFTADGSNHLITDDSICDTVPASHVPHKLPKGDKKQRFK